MPPNPGRLPNLNKIAAEKQQKILALFMSITYNKKLLSRKDRQFAALLSLAQPEKASAFSGTGVFGK